MSREDLTRGCYVQLTVFSIAKDLSQNLSKATVSYHFNSCRVIEIIWNVESSVTQITFAEY